MPFKSYRWKPKVDFNQGIVNIRINGIDYPIHASVILTSEYLKQGVRSLNKSRRGTPIIKVNWSGSAAIFDTYSHWLYEREILTTSQIKGHVVGQTNLLHDFTDLVYCWCFGQTIADAPFQDMVISTLIQKVQASEWERTNFLYCLSAELVVETYKATTPDSLLRQFVADAIARFAKGHMIDNLTDTDGYPVTFKNDILKAFGRQASGAGVQAAASQVPGMANNGFAERQGPNHGFALCDPQHVVAALAVPREVGFAEVECAYHIHRHGQCFRAGQEQLY